LTSNKTKSASKDDAKPKRPLVQEVLEGSSSVMTDPSAVGAVGPDSPPPPPSQASASSVASDPAARGGGGGGSSKGAPLIKKGFLSAAKEKGVSLYPEGGSNEGTGGAKGGA
jgi:hypothetical protein